MGLGWTTHTIPSFYALSVVSSCTLAIQSKLHDAEYFPKEGESNWIKLKQWLHSLPYRGDVIKRVQKTNSKMGFCLFSIVKYQNSVLPFRIYLHI